MNILFTNSTLTERTGSEVFVFDLARSLVGRGHHAVIYTNKIGKFASEVRAAGVDVIDRGGQLEFRPDVIHGQHFLPTLEVIEAFHSVPAIFVCHGATPDPERPPRHERIMKYVGVDIMTRDRIVRETGKPASEVAIIPNAVDTSHFMLRSNLPAKIGKVLIFTNSKLDSKLLGAVTDACIASEFQLGLAGKSFGKFTDRPENVLGGYDVVIAKARCALEALAVGCSVILGDAQGMGPMVTRDNVSQLREYNFGYSLLTKPWTKEGLIREFWKYNRVDAEDVTRYIRLEARLNKQVVEFEALYESVIHR